MPNPKQRHSYRRTHTRRAHDFLTAPQMQECAKCGELTVPHRICKSCGHYKNIAYTPQKTEE